jgi:hypothetical protein
MRQGERTDKEQSANLQNVSQEEAAKKLSVSTRSAACAKSLKAATTISPGAGEGVFLVRLFNAKFAKLKN